MLTRQRPPVDLDAIIERAGIPVVERVLVDGVRWNDGGSSPRNSATWLRARS
jgi:hypothetical protein